MKVRHFPISCEALHALFTTGAEHKVRIAAGFPADGKVRGAYTEEGRVVVVVESQEFEEVRLGGEPPLRIVTVEHLT